MSALRFWLLLLVAAALSALPLIGLPLRWAGTFFHELSHGLMAAATGGDIVRIVLRTDGSGLCVFTGGWGVPVAFAGYAGAPLWGLGIFALASGDSQRDDAPILAGLLEPTSGRAVVTGHLAGTLGARAALSFIPDDPVLYDDLSKAHAQTARAPISGNAATDLAGSVAPGATELASRATP